MSNSELTLKILEVYTTPQVTESALRDERLQGYDHELVKSTIRALRATGFIRDISGEKRTLVSVASGELLTDEKLKQIGDSVEKIQRPSPNLFGNEDDE